MLRNFGFVSLMDANSLNKSEAVDRFPKSEIITSVVVSSRI